MIDFIEYVVSELRSRRLSKAEAAALVRQFSHRPPSSTDGAWIHPLLHRNASDLSEQRYQSTFTGEEFFLADHQVRADGQPAARVLPGVACLEMARAAVQHALPERPDAAVLELRNIVWAHPIVVTGTKDVSVALVASDDHQTDFEIYSEEADRETIHCQGRAVWSREPAPAMLDLAQLERQMEQGPVEPGSVYAACAGMGVIYGPAFQGMTAMHRGSGQVLAQLRLPRIVESTSGDYVLHPSLLDAALQASLGLLDDWSELVNAPRLPFAVDSFRIVAPCVREMVAWVRYSPGSHSAAKLIKVDVDLCDERGNVCVQVRGFCWRVLKKEIGATAPAEEIAAPAVPQEQPLVAAGMESASLAEKTQDYLRRQFAAVLRLPSHEIDPRAALENYGIDSMVAMKLTNQLEKTLGSLPKTLFFEYQTIRDLAEYFISHHADSLAVLVPPPANRVGEEAPAAAPASPAAPGKVISTRRSARRQISARKAAVDSEPIAIIGLSGRYPEAVDLDAYWKNLRDGKDCIIEVPKERWDWREYYSDDRTDSGAHHSKWGGFIAGVDEFDPLFFNISPVEAELMDPQERLFLQHAWMAMEDAGYTRAGLQVPHEHDLPGQAGVYVGLMYTEYQLFGAEVTARGRRLGLATSPASIANRVSYFLNLHGPSMTLDTMCSSSLTAIHVACQDLRQGRISLAIAGGVNVTIHPNKYLWLSAGQFISTDGHCQSFGEGGDGYIPGEGVGVAVLKRLSEAERDGDLVYGIIRGSALNHGGKTNGYSVPNPQAQATVISRVLAESQIDARHISYIEAHGTGTKLGDPIEIAALSKAFAQSTQDTGFCLIGSAKSNIGHCESAAGIAGLTKVLLQMQHQQIVPSLHSATLNPHIDFDTTPFVVNQTLRPWAQPVIDGRTLPRIAGISSFGAGGSNAHLIVEEYQPPVRQPMVLPEAVIVLSAKTGEQLREKAGDLLEFVQPRLSTLDLAATAYTLQVGREAMEHRLGFLVSSAGQLAEKLRAYLAGEQGIEDAYQGQLKRNNEALSLFSVDADLQLTVDRWIANGKLPRLLDLWVKGLDVDWSRLYGETKPRRISLPTYPFARERCWVDMTVSAPGAAQGAVTAVLHPLLHSNTSDLSGQRYRSTFTGEEFFLADHQVKADGRTARKILPAVACLEMARAAIDQALPERPESTVLELLDTVWAQPIVVTGKKQISISLLVNHDDQIDFEISSHDAGDEVVHCQGRAVLRRASAPAPLDLGQLSGQMERGRMEPAGVYAACTRMGLVYGPSFQAITAVHRGSHQVLARLRLPDSVQATAASYVLHPSLMDAALQAAVGLLDASSAHSSQPRLPFALDSLRLVSPCTAEMAAWVRYSPGSRAEDAAVKLDIDLCDERGNLCVQMRGFSSRLISTAAGQAIGTLLARPVWEVCGLEAAETGRPGDAEHHVLVCELPHVDSRSLESLIARSHCVSLSAGSSGSLAERYTGYAAACFERIQSLMQSNRQGEVLVQLAVAGEGEPAVMAGLSGLLRTAALENPRFRGQLLVVPSSTATEELARQLAAEKLDARDVLIRHEHGARYVSAWREIALEAEAPPIAFRGSGVYLITGGLGGLGVLFAREILDRTREARVILTGRSPWSAETQARLDALSAQSGRVSYRQLDLGDADQVRQLIASVVQDHGQLNGILHSAGMIADSFILKKGSTRFREVLAPKVTGTDNLDQASQEVPLDFFILFSSFAGPVGNPGQADYAAANGFLDQFAAHRNRLVAARQRHGRTLSINWPLWQAGGMGIDPAGQEALQETIGMQPMQTVTGMDAFHRSLALPYDQIGVMEGDPVRMRRALFGASAPPAVPQTEPPAIAAGVDAETLAEKTQEHLRKELSGPLKLPSHRIDPHAALEQYGIDSILAVKLTNHLEKTFGPLSRTLFFEYRTIRELAEYFIAHHGARLAALLSPEALPVAAPVPESVPARLLSSRRFVRPDSTAPRVDLDSDPIAIVGLSGRYPQAFDLEAYWQNLREGKDCITEVPRERWDWREYYSEDRTRSGHHYSKWGGFIAGVDEFDPLFFNISPAEAELIDPQERLFLQHAWMAMEDAGYTRAGLQVPCADDLPGQVGVYVGVMYSEYQVLGAGAGVRGERVGIPGSAAGVANRVSYALNLHGPSIMLDTMCSSSLTALHLASMDLRLGRISMAIAGGVNVSIHPNKYLVLSAGQFISGDGHCQSFGHGGDGYIPGEGVGAVVLKRLSDAKRDGDHIYGIIRGSAVNHGGRTNGYTVPNPQAQATVISRALAESHVDPRHISYIEAHGTGTKLGDPIEIAALSKSFGRYTQDTGFCLIGSAKSNIGHCESAAGIAGLTKVLLQMQHQQIVPSLHSEELNPHIDFSATPFVVNQALRPWEPPVIDGRTLPRIAGISSFGAGGANAHLIVEEYPQPVSEPIALANVVILLSARTAGQLRQKARDLLDFIEPRLNTVDLVATAYTLQAGREAMEERLGFIVSSPEQLAEKLRAYGTGEEGIEGAYQGQVNRTSEALSLFSTDADLRQAIDQWIAGGKLAKLLELWVNGLELDWSKLYGETRPPRISLPTYPFARERHWIDTMSSKAVAGAAAAALHPLLHRNTSDLNEQRYSSTFTGAEFFLSDHQVQAGGRAAQKILPAVAQLEMARAAIALASPEEPETAVLELRNVVWAEPIVVAGEQQVHIALVPGDDETIDYEIYSQGVDREIVHGQGRALVGRQPAPAPLDLEQLEKQMGDGELEPDGVYRACARMGLIYGPSFQGVTAVRRGSGQLLARLRLPATVRETAGDYVLHPSLVDSALHAWAGSTGGSSEGDEPLRVPFALDSLRILSPCTAEMVAWVRYSPGSQAGDSVVRLDVDLSDERGNVCVQMHGLSSRLLSNDIGRIAEPEQAIGTLLAVPVWEADSVEASADAGKVEIAEHHVVLCELSKVDAGMLESMLPRSRCLSLHGEQQKTVAQRYCEYAVASFEWIQTILRSKPQGKVLVQIVVGDDFERALLAGLSGLLKTAALENPRFIGQLMLVPAGVEAEPLARHLRDEKTLGFPPLVRYEQGARRVLRWQDVPAALDEPATAFKDRGVYLITGGLGGLGVLFAREILDRAPEARVVLSGRSALSAEKQALLDGLSAQADRVSYRQVDLADADQVKRLIAGVLYDHYQLDGILHCAGMTADRFILKKTGTEFTQVLEPKVTGTFHLDQATQGVELDFFVLFSSIAGALGNVGQADYATANGFMDQFAAYRNRRVAAGERRGRTLSINWPLWQAGGMGIDPGGLELLQQTTGMLPMPTATGMRAFHRSLALPHDQILIVEGDLARIRRALMAGRPVAPEQRASRPVASGPAVAGSDSGSLLEKTKDYLRRELSSLLKLPPHEIDPQAALEKYGIDSVLTMKLTNQLEKSFGSLSKTLFYEYQTLAALAGYFVKAHPAAVRETVGLVDARPAARDTGRTAIDQRRPAVARRSRSRFAGPQPNTHKDIAIVGLAGRYPQAENLQEFWRNLRSGRDCITEIPSERWDHQLYYDADPDQAGKSYSKWGGFIADIDKFDPLFFNISPKEAAITDPQERLFLETAWQTIEDAGYTRETFSGKRVGVYVGVMWGQYELFGAESLLRGNGALAGSSYASIANRVSYFFDLHGPSIALDTMCSSSLTAIHLACEELRKGEIEAAIAGGVNLAVHPYKYVSLSQGRFVASDGRCRSFGEGGDGYVPGEGVGAVLLKPLENALRDGDQIYAVIKSSTVNHGGKTNGYSVPNPNAQADLIREALQKAQIDPFTLSYIETHGTGTSLGDPIEITGLSKAFEGSTGGKQFCPIGSVKSNIGHLESAAGIAAVTKALLQIRHKELVPSLHAQPLNPYIDFAETPFYVQTGLAEWKRPAAHPRRAGVSSFGAGGSNAHLILEEYADAREAESASHPAAPELFVLSARDRDALVRYAGRVVHFLEDASGVSLANLAYTSQVGRTPMDARLAIVVTSVEDLRVKLNEWISLRGNPAELAGVFHGNSKEALNAAGSLIDGPAGKAFLDDLLANRELEKVARLWILDVEIDWDHMSRQVRPRRVSLPTYPFARERHWVDQETAAPLVVRKKAGERGNAVSGAQPSAKVRRSVPAPAEGVDRGALVAKTEAYLKALIGEEIKLDPERIGSSDPLESFGLDSVMINRVNAKLEKELGPLPKTLLYEHETVRELATFLVRDARETLTNLFGVNGSPGDPALPSSGIEEEAIPHEVSAAGEHDGLEAIAIIGMHGNYPHSATPDAYWDNLKEGRDLVDLVPPDRWNYEELHDPDPAAAADGKIYCKWGGFLQDHDRFDPGFFHISTAEAKVMDPQERLFLESVWTAIEDAGYTRDTLRTRFPKNGSADVGVFVGVTTNTYHLWAPEERSRGNFVSPTSMPWSIANRVSYFCDFSGPSLPVDTACSSSLVAIHLACESLRKRECQVAIAGGVNLYLHPAKYQSMCERRMLSLDGKCHSYGAGGDGFVPGEGVGTVVLKPLGQAIEDGDRIYAVLRASAFDHSGRSNGYSAPNPNSQASLISHTLESARIHPETIGYVEGHGTGTQLGDSLEIAALTQAFRRQTEKKQFCPVGSVKANMGHAESAAGIAGVAKVLLQLEHRQLAPSIHSDERNANIEFDDSPFYLQHGLAEWPAADHPRRALVNSFGAGGVNACVVVEEFETPRFPVDGQVAGPYLFTLSAKNEDRLREYVDRVLTRLGAERDLDLASFCYTLQIGREAMDERLAAVVTDAAELIEQLAEWSRRGAAAGIHRGSVGPRQGSRRPKLAGPATGEQSLTELAARWTAGEEVEWESLYEGSRPCRISAPTYPFARERYWVSDSAVLEKATRSNAQLHPLIACNSSMLQEVSFSSLLSDTAFYAVDHKVHEERVFPGAGFLEMACISGNVASEQKVRKIRDVVWIHPLTFRTGPQALRTVLRPAGEGVEYAISSFDDEGETIVHSEGRLVFGSGEAKVSDADDRMPLEALKAQCERREEGAALYRQFGEYGLHYGPSFQTIQELYVNGSFALARLKITDRLRGDFSQFILHPSMIDGALQTAAGLAESLAPRTPYLPFAVDEIEILRAVPRTCYAYAERADAHAQNHAGVTKFNIRLLSESGDVLVRITNLYVRPLARPSDRGHPIAPAGTGRLVR
jgi:polyketide synthase PksN